MFKKLLASLKDDQGGQSIKSAIGIFVFILFVVVSVLINNPDIPLSYKVAFGSSHGGSGGGGGGGGSSISSGTYSTPVKKEVSFSVSQALGYTDGVKPDSGTVMNFTVPAERVSEVSTVKLQAVGYGSLATSGAVGSLPTGLSPVNDHVLKVSITNLSGNEVSVKGTVDTRFEYSSDQVSKKDVSSFLVHRWDGSGWTALPTRISTGNNVVVVNGTASKTSYFTVLGKPGIGLSASNVPVAAVTTDRTSLIASLRQQIANLMAQVLGLIQDSLKSGKTISTEAQKQLASLTASTTVVPTSIDDLPPASLGKGDKGANVTKLQALLIKWNIGSSVKVLAQIGATGYYGDLTVAAVYELQQSLINNNTGPAAQSLKKAFEQGYTGGWGPLTRAAEVEYIKSK